MKNTKNAANMLMSYSIAKLIELWNETEKQALDTELTIVRGWIMDALEQKDQEAFYNWLDNCDTDDNMAHYFH